MNVHSLPALILEERLCRDGWAVWGAIGLGRTYLGARPNGAPFTLDLDHAKRMNGTSKQAITLAVPPDLWSPAPRYEAGFFTSVKNLYALDRAIPSRRAMATALSLSTSYKRRSSLASIVGLRPLWTPLSLAAAMPSSCRSRPRLVSSSANTPKLCRRMPRPQPSRCRRAARWP